MTSIGLVPKASNFIYMKGTNEIFHPRESENWEGTYTEKEGQGAVKFTVQTPEDLKEILDLCEKMTPSIFSVSPTTHFAHLL